jgi:hypothetical protein
VQGKQINPHIIDTVKVQVAFVGEQRRNARVLRVLEYNDQVLGNPLDENALAAMLGVFNRKSGQEPGLFDNSG